MACRDRTDGLVFGKMLTGLLRRRTTLAIEGGWNNTVRGVLLRLCILRVLGLQMYQGL